MSRIEPRSSVSGLQLVLYDGDCPLCHRAVRFLLRHDRRGVLSFAPLQGVTALELRERLDVPDDLDSMLFVRNAGAEGEALLEGSTAVLGALDTIGGPWRLLSWLRVVPRPLRDAVYDFVARRRHRWFGRLHGCPLPDSEQRERFLD